MNLLLYVVFCALHLACGQVVYEDTDYPLIESSETTSAIYEDKKRTENNFGNTVDKVDKKVDSVEKISPSSDVSALERKFKTKQEFRDWLLKPDALRSNEESNPEYESFDGWFNNRGHSTSGAVDSELIRILSSSYDDGVYKPAGASRPNPFNISDTIMKDELESRSKAGKTALLVYFGQQVTDEILDARRPGCPPEYYNIKIPNNHYYYESMKHTQMPFVRSRYDKATGLSSNNPRRQLNEATPWIDGGVVYGTSKSWSDLLRSFNKGKLKSMDDDPMLPAYNTINLPMYNPPVPGLEKPKLLPVSRFFRLGDRRGNENPFLLTMGVLWFRWHNFIAEGLADLHNDWSDEKIFNEARKWVIASQQQIVMNEWLPIWLGEALPPYKNYDGGIDPQISHVFQSAAMRYGHTLVTAGGYKRARNCSALPRAIRTCNSFWDSTEHLLDNGFEELILGLSSQPAAKDDAKIVDDIRTYVYGPLEFTRRDLAAINIQRGRDHGLPDYLTARKILSLRYDFKDFHEIAANLWPAAQKDQALLHAIEELYKSKVNDIDIWVGGMLETTEYQPGELFRAIMLDQFRRIRDGDRFWFQNHENNLFTKEEIARIEKLTIHDIIMSVTSIKEEEIQKRPFKLPNDNGNKLILNACIEQMQKHSYECVINLKSKEKSSCYALSPINATLTEKCTSPKTFDYVLGSEITYITTFSIVAVFIIAFEWNGDDEESRPVEINLQRRTKSISIKLFGGKAPIRIIDLRNTTSVIVQASANSSKNFVLLRIPKEYDLILKFDEFEEKEQFLSKLDIFLGEISVGRERREVDLKKMLKYAYTKEKRQAHLESFFKAIFAHAFGMGNERENIDVRKAKEIVNTELTQFEFADALALRPDSLFVQQMFALVDKDNNGYISFREFLDMMVIFAKGSADQKAKLMFDMYDLDRTGRLSKGEFSLMIRSMLELANQTITAQQMEQLVTTMYDAAGLSSKNELDLSDFLKLLGDFKDEFVSNFQGVQQTAQQRRRSALVRANDTVVRAYSYFGGDGPASESKCEPKIKIRTEKTTKEPSLWTRIVRFVDERKSHIFWMFLYNFILVYIFVDKAFYYTFLKEDSGLRQIAGLGVTITRGAASVMMFAYSTLLLTVSRNIITFLRETFLHHYIPFDAAITFHKYIAVVGLIFSLIHSIGHAINFYHITTQPPDDISCLFREVSHNSDELPKFSYWCFQTITGTTGVLVLLLLLVLYIFAMEYSRRYIFNAFWATHNLYPIIYLLIIMHGLGRIVQSPIFYKFLTIPLIIFVIDRLISLSRKKVELSVIRAVHHPSDVTYLEFKRPPSFEYKSGQWMRIACLALNRNEYHPFTISSAPHEDNLQLYIRAVGPFTKNIRQIYDPTKLKCHPYPKLYLDGPYGEGHQDWFRYEVSVLVGGGIGVTPFASILKDISYRSSSTVLSKTTCKKVFFIWVTRTQKHFEWLVDIIRDVEKKDTRGLVNTHIFITQFYEKFDLRTTMLYICERHFQRISNKSLFTGLTAKTHFGRPDFAALFNSLQLEYPKVNRIGVFSCGPPPMTSSVQKGCEQMNRKEGAIFIHHYENF
ncbi:dual oxidase 2-like isoform X1 [Dinothrombium tinctorium]|uniref:NAD(P)H oxidase (H2O2-forming) n=1 Tax=Dinothrombium tinctorium TaxID=1965070 RepID=A0A3S3SDB7_9ACAR|nr:dual oxidase 2-like isoform X1 [Dinothrombium tinctorium]RWS13899.1 dual oxidase 2-like isoform X1 [Dinothrombium tinctorium]